MTGEGWGAIPLDFDGDVVHAVREGVPHPLGEHHCYHHLIQSQSSQNRRDEVASCQAVAAGPSHALAVVSASPWVGGCSPVPELALCLISAWSTLCVKASPTHLESITATITWCLRSGFRLLWGRPSLRVPPIIKCTLSVHPYRGTSLIRNRPPPSALTWP